LPPFHRSLEEGKKGNITDQRSTVGGVKKGGKFRKVQKNFFERRRKHRCSTPFIRTWPWEKKVQSRRPTRSAKKKGPETSRLGVGEKIRIRSGTSKKERGFSVILKKGTAIPIHATRKGKEGGEKGSLNAANQQKDRKLKMDSLRPCEEKKTTRCFEIESG